jgi:hypothetical protein
MRLLSIILFTIAVVAGLGLVVAFCLPSGYLSDLQRFRIFLASFGTGALVAAVRSTLGIWLPRFRGYWGGPFSGRTSQNDPDRMSLGRVSQTGGAILCTGFALATFSSLLNGPTAKPSRIGVLPSIFLTCIFTGFFLVMVGWLLDSRAHDAARRGPRRPGEPRTTPEERLRWIAVACGTAILLMMILALIFLK